MITHPVVTSNTSVYTSSTTAASPGRKSGSIYPCTTTTQIGPLREIKGSCPTRFDALNCSIVVCQAVAGSAAWLAGSSRCVPVASLATRRALASAWDSDSPGVSRRIGCAGGKFERAAATTEAVHAVSHDRGSRVAGDTVRGPGAEAPPFEAAVQNPPTATATTAAAPHLPSLAAITPDALSISLEPVHA